MRTFKLSLLATAGLLVSGTCVSNFAMADTPVKRPDTTTSFQGFSGYFNVPSAYNFGDGEIVFMHGNQSELINHYQSTPNFHFAAAFSDYLEVTGRNMAHHNTTTKGSDLSANIKFTLPYIPGNWFKLAVGIQDLGGASNFLDSKYAVLSRYFVDFNLDASIGVGQSESSFGRMDGVFGAVKWQPYEWGAVLAEYDAVSANYGVELSTPKDWLGGNTRIFAKAMLGASEDNLTNHTYWGIGISTNMYQTRAEITPALAENVIQTGINEVQASAAQNQAKQAEPLLLIRQALRKRKFTDFKLGLNPSGEHLTVRVENNRYSGNHIDTFSVVMAIVAQYAPESVAAFTVEITQAGIVVDSVATSVVAYRNFLQGGELQITSGNSAQSVNWLEEDSSFFVKPSLTLYPHIKSTVGTEFGMLDYSLALATHLELPIPVWPGLTATAFHLTQLTESQDVDRGRIPNFTKHDNGLQTLTLNQAINLPFNTKALVSFGKFARDYKMLGGELGWRSDNGQHQFFVYSGKYEYSGEKSYYYYRPCVANPNNSLSSCLRPLPEHSDKQVSAIKYRYYSPWLNTSIFTKYGKFWAGDKGIDILVSRYFDDFEVNLSFKATKDADEGLSTAYVYEDEYQKTIGLGFTYNFGVRKDINNRFINVTTRADWSYVLNTLVGEEHNGLTYGLADEARTYYHLDNHFNNFGRSGTSYLQRHQDRLRAAYFEL
ncbi:YjbH domain-containing protein [Catenovulum agarivorans]|uniref:YjbH domain-containing protein n=1 Tax=Catenovulum agarivorans TaxID=1172192 RepID=UPI000310E66F|nr:YjbH domain-containing protein [Catenovulum agarivorans]